MKRSPGPGGSVTSASHSTTSPCPMLLVAVSTMRRFISCIGLWMPGVSKSTIWAPGRFTTARMRLRVVWGLSETIATFWPTSRFTRVDLPTFGRPTTVTKPARKGTTTASLTPGSRPAARRKRTRLTRCFSAASTSTSNPR